MKVAFLGSNEKEIQALNIYFLKNFAPKEGLELLKLSEGYREYRDKNTGDFYIIRIMHEGVKGYKFNKIYYMNTIREELTSYIYNCLTTKEEYVGDRFIELGLDLEIKFN